MSGTYATQWGDRLKADSGQVARIAFGGSSAGGFALRCPSVHGDRSVRDGLRSTDTPDCSRGALALLDRTRLPSVVLTVLQLSPESTGPLLQRVRPPSLRRLCLRSRLRQNARRKSLRLRSYVRVRVYFQRKVRYFFVFFELMARLRGTKMRHPPVLHRLGVLGGLLFHNFL